MMKFNTIGLVFFLLPSTLWGATMSSYPTKTTPVAADTVLISDSQAANATKKATLGSISPTDATITTTDVTTNNASTTKHGWILKATAPSSGLRNIVAIDNGETVYKNAALFDATSPSTQAFGDAADVGTAMTSARRDHKHAMPAAPTTITGNAGTATALAANGTNCSAGQAALGVDASGNAEGCWSPSGASAAGSNTQVQFNDGGTSFGGDAGLTYNKTTDSLTVVGTLTAGTFASSAADGSRRSILPSNTTITPSGGGVVEIYNEGGAIKAVEADTEYDVLLSRDIGASVQAYDADLTTWSGITPGTGVGTFLATPSGANLASALTSALPATKGGTGLTALGTGVATAMGNATNGTGGFVTYDIDLATVAAPGNWKTLYSDGSGNIKTLSNSATSGYVLTSTGATSAPAWQAVGAGSMTWPAGAGIVVYSGSSSWGTSLTAPSGAIVGTTDTQTLSGKTLSSFELGSGATDTTITRDSAGVMAIEGVKVTRTIASGTSALGTSAISSGACATAVTTSATGVATTDVINWGFNGDPTGVTGYAPSANGMLTIIAYPSANNVNYKVCNNTASSITPGAITLNWQVTR